VTLSFSNCTYIGQIVWALWAIAFTTFFVSYVVLGKNIRKDYEPTKIESIIEIIVPFVFKRDSLQEHIIGWYTPYKISGILIIPLSLILFGGASSGILCTPS